ncbi:hypothetical protein CHLNCDRAFT_51491 [Chlorella variabilis]|uniref:Uncharacterized protein n=1 Tax=Chlorella variabilis TaxID=554065 RepID=E1ZBZ3_CHLVA|nr:hypothetical protein CHLNCDRAFT_51491 [Chlorella variabilis]EFN56519.1 hypothetical protein CHLNCDRAFT_51491 [Chlorella variabilis]|eukprot:XP_005848621.1 hypothetical protein CHLNCDRAFT_51491 [Chlorella variabilis]
MGGKKFRFVYIPCDMSEPLQQWELEMPPGKEVECLIDRLKAHFASHGPQKTSAQVKAQQAELMSKLPEGTSIDSKVLDVATSLHMVENISLLSNAKDNGFVGVNMYVDDEGSIRGLPRNLRASEIAHCCGKPLEVKGDAFLARVMDNGDDFDRLDLELGEVSSGAAWVKAAASQNERKRQQARRGVGWAGGRDLGRLARGWRESGEALLERMRAGRDAAAAAGAAAGAAAAAKQAAVRELTPAEAAKDEGNNAFKRGDWRGAMEQYTRALELEPGMVAALNNRAMARLKMQQWAEAEADCSAVLAAEPRNVKALLRRAAAAAALGRQPAAADDWRAVLALEPQNREAAAGMAGVEAAVAQQQQQAQQG